MALVEHLSVQGGAHSRRGAQRNVTGHRVLSDCDSSGGAVWFFFLCRSVVVAIGCVRVVSVANKGSAVCSAVFRVAPFRLSSGLTAILLGGRFGFVFSAVRWLLPVGVR